MTGIVMKIMKRILLIALILVAGYIIVDIEKEQTGQNGVYGTQGRAVAQERHQEKN